MPNLIAPPAIVFVNNDLTPSVQSAVERQLFITETISGEEFDFRIAVDPNYPQAVKGNNLRVLVIRSFFEHANRELADIVIFIKAGLASVLKNNFGPPGMTFPVDYMYLSQLFFTSGYKGPTYPTPTTSITPETPIEPKFDPANLSLTTWYQDYPGGAWPGTASVNYKSAINKAEKSFYGNLPTEGPSVNGHRSAHFTNAGQSGLDQDLNGYAIFGPTSWSFSCLMKANILQPALSVHQYESVPILQDAYGWVGIYVDQGGVFAYQDEGPTPPLIHNVTPSVPVTVGEWFLAQARWTGHNLQCRVNGGAWSTVPNVDGAYFFSDFVLGATFYGDNFLDGDILELMTSQESFDDRTFNNILAYSRNKYSLPLT